MMRVLETEKVMVIIIIGEVILEVVDLVVDQIGDEEEEVVVGLMIGISLEVVEVTVVEVLMTDIEEVVTED